MFDQDLISVIIPVYNVADYLPRCLESILKNTYKNLEIICINDGSTDNSLEILEEYKEKDNRIIIVNQENKGLSSARNIGLQLSKGEYVSFVDSDDWVHIKYFELLYTSVKKNYADIAVCNYKKTDSDMPELDIEDDKEEIINTVAMIRNYRTKHYVWRRLYRHDILKNIWFDENETIEDYVFNMDIIVYGKHDLRIVYLDLQLYYYYQRNNSLVSKINMSHTLLLSERLCRYLDYTDSDEIKGLIADEGVSYAISARHAYIVLRDKKMIKRCNAIIKICIKFMKKKRVLYLLFWIFPELYRQGRIRNDKSISSYEQVLRETFKNGK